MKTIILFTQDDFYKVHHKNMMNMYSSAMSKWLKIFVGLSKKLNLKMYSFRPKAYKNQRPHGSDITIVNEDDLKSMKFDYAYINKDPGLSIFNIVNPTIIKKVYMFNENDKFSNSIDKVDILGHCSINSYLHIKQPGVVNLLTPNICNGNKIKAEKVERKNKVVIIGRYSAPIVTKVLFMAEEFPEVQFDVYATKFWNFKANKWVGFGPHQSDRVWARKIFRENNPFKNIILKKPIQHNVFYETMMAEGYKIGFAPSIIPMQKRKPVRQVNSSSKFYDYIGAGIPVLAEDKIPESLYINQNNYIGKVYKNSSFESLKEEFLKMIEEKYDYEKIIKYAQSNHYPEHRIEIIARELIK